jgi:hypothetical protein
MLSLREKSILVGLYLSKFDILGLNKIGFQSFNEAFNTLGYSLGTKPASIKNYRDEFDPFFPNNRKGWHRRPIRDYCKAIYEKYNSYDIETFSRLIKNFLFDSYDIEEFLEQNLKSDISESIAKRLITGKAAEEYFKKEYINIDNFYGFELRDTTNLACGFDFKLSKENDFYCIEVKGLQTNKGGILMTEKEYTTAEKLKEKYCIFLVKNFAEKPEHTIFFNPINSSLLFKKQERNIIQISYTAVI